MPKTKHYNYTIREATKEDVVDLTILGKQFVKESQNYELLGWNGDKVYDSLLNIIERDDFGVFVLCCESEVVGMLICLSTPCFFSNVVQAVELVWYVDPSHRGSREALKMLDTYEEWAKSKEAVFTNLINLDVLNGKKIAKLYARRGYRIVENTFIKEI